MPQPDRPRRSPRRILVIANQTCASPRVVEEVVYRAGSDARVLVVAPALARSRLRHWLSSDVQGDRAMAMERLESSVGALNRAGIHTRGELGDADPLQALDDAMRVFAPDEIIISTHTPARSHWLEKRVVQRARERYRIPVTHVVVDLDREAHDHEVRADPRSRETAAPERRLRLYHIAGYEGALAIRASGFRDSPVDGGGSGVLLADHPPALSGADDDPLVLTLSVPEEVVAPYARAGAASGAREFVVPADLANRYGPPVAADEDAIE
jgi:hypothetical protein